MDQESRGKRFITREALGELVQSLRDGGHTVVAPVERDGIISLRPVEGTDEIARGLNDHQEPGRYRIEEGDPEAWFDHVVGPDSPKQYFFPPEHDLFSITERDGDFEFEPGSETLSRTAFLGIRPCELAAIRVQDRVYGEAPDQQPFRCEIVDRYRQARESSLLLVVNCTRPSGTCFCASMDTGPQAGEGFDLALTELRAGFVVTLGSERGEAILERVEWRYPSPTELELEELKLNRARDHMGRTFDVDGVKELLDASIEHSHWDRVAERCLTCGNCTMVCPTCFCSTVTDVDDLQTGAVRRVQRWESCFTMQFSYTTGGPWRQTVRSRYRHWLRHKLATWWDQFGCSGCVGCGRCITWCPVGIDLTEEVEAIRAAQASDPEEIPTPDDPRPDAAPGQEPTIERGHAMAGRTVNPAGVL